MSDRYKNGRTLQKWGLGCLLAFIFQSQGLAQSQVSSVPNIQTGINIQGFSGLINVPSAHTIGYGEFHLQYNNLSDGGYYGQPQQYIDGNVLSISTSPFPGLEATIRNSGRNWDEGSDLQANLKYQATFIPKEWFSLAAGYQDVGGITNQQDSYFVALSKDWENWRFTVGTGVRSSTKIGYPNRYEGGFYGLQYQPYDWLQLQAEHDGVNHAAAIRFSTPAQWLGGQAQLYGSVIIGDYATDSQQDPTFFQIGLRYNMAAGPSRSLDSSYYATQQLETRLPGWFESEDYQYYVPPVLAYSDNPYYDDNVVLQNEIQQQLTEHGFEDVWVGMNDTTMYVRLENFIYNRSAIDGLGVALGMITQSLSEHVQWVDFTLSRYGVPTLRLVTDAYDLTNFYAGKQLSPHFRVAPPRKRSDVIADWSGGDNHPSFIPRVTLAPELTKFIGTEIGQADLDLALRTNISVGLWQGGEVIADYDVNLAHSSDFTLGRSLGKYQQTSGLRHAMFRQTIALPFNVYVAANVGLANTSQLEEHHFSTLQASWQNSSGQHRVTYDYGYFATRQANGQDRTIYSLGYRYYMPFFDMSVTTEAGQYWSGDRGYKLGLTRQIGDSTLGVYVSRTDVNLQGIQFSIPLGTRKNMSAQRYGIQVRPASTWQQTLATSSYNGTNQIFVKRGYKPDYMRSLEMDYFNHDRLSWAKINTHLPRLREAFARYVLKQR